MDEIDSNDTKKQGRGDAPWLNKRVGNAPRRSRILNINDYDNDPESDVVDTEDIQRQMEVISNRRSRPMNERECTVKGDVTGRENLGLDRKASYQVISDEFDDSMGFPQQNRIRPTRGEQADMGSVSQELRDLTVRDSVGLQQGSGVCRNSFGRRRSFNSEFDDDEEAMEIKELMKKKTISSTEGRKMLLECQRRQDMKKGAIHGNYTESNRSGVDSQRRRSLELGSDDEEAEEIKELIRNETLSALEGRKRLQDLQSRRIINRGPSQTNQGMDSPHTFGSDGFPQNWSRDSQMSHSEFKLVPLCDGDKEYEQIYSEMEQAGLDVVRVERLQNVDLLEKFKSEMMHMARRKNQGTSISKILHDHYNDTFIIYRPIYYTVNLEIWGGGGI